MEPPRLRLRLHAELALQDANADLILRQRRVPPSAQDVQAHAGAVRRLLQRIEGEQLAGDLDRAVDASGRGFERDETRRGIDGALAQPLALGEEPRFERLLVHAEFLEKLAAVERERLGE